MCVGGGGVKGTLGIPLYILFLDDSVHCFSTFVYVLRICNRLKRQQLFLVFYATVQLALVTVTFRWNLFRKKKILFNSDVCKSVVSVNNIYLFIFCGSLLWKRISGFNVRSCYVLLNTVCVTGCAVLVERIRNDLSRTRILFNSGSEVGPTMCT